MDVRNSHCPPFCSTALRRLRDAAPLAIHTIAASLSSLRRTLPLAALGAFALLNSGCVAVDSNPVARGGPPARLLIVSVRDQKLTVLRTDGSRLYYPISTSKFGLGDHRRHFETPTGNLEIAQKVGGGAPAGAVFKGRVRTGEVIAVNAPGRDPIVTRILALRGLDPNNRDALSRGIYIHGTPEERNIGTPSSFGCIRMRSRDVIELYDIVNVGTRVQILDTTRNQALSAYNATVPQPPPQAPAPSASIGGGATQTEEAEAASSKIAASAPPAASRSRGAAAAPGADTRHEWAGSPSRLLATKGNTVAAVPAAAPASRSTGTRDARPASNETEVTDASNGNSRSRTLKRPALDAL
jgi:hypothetical protein